MSNPVKPYTFVDVTDAEADQVNANFDALFGWIATGAVHADASKSFTAIPTGPNQNPTSDNQFARKRYVDDKIAGAPRVVGYTQSTWNNSFATGMAAIPGTSLSLTYTSGHVYRFTAASLIQIQSGGNGYVMALIEGSTQRGRFDQDNSAHDLGHLMNGVVIRNDLSGVRTFAVGVQTVAGTGTLRGDITPHFLLVEDLGNQF